MSKRKRGCVVEAPPSKGASSAKVLRGGGVVAASLGGRNEKPNGRKERRESKAREKKISLESNFTFGLKKASL